MENSISEPEWTLGCIISQKFSSIYLKISKGVEYSEKTYFPKFRQNRLISWIATFMLKVVKFVKKVKISKYR